MPADHVVVAQDLTCDFGTVRALDHVSFDVKQGEIFGLLGHNGAGKTTLIREINGLLRPSDGTVRTLGLDPIADGSTVRSRTGVLTEYPALDAFLSPLENLLVYAQIHGMKDAEARGRAVTLLDQLALPQEKWIQPARNLSAGLKQRVALARALIHSPELLLLDEPTSNLDPLAARGVRDLALQLSREEGRTIILSTHNLAEAQALCDRVAILKFGRLLAVGSLDDLGGHTATATVHIRTGSPEEAASARQDLQRDGHPRGTVSILADRATIAVSTSQEDVPDLVALLVRGGVDIHAVVPQTPTLEDVYVNLHRPGAPGGPSPQTADDASPVPPSPAPDGADTRSVTP